MPITVLPANISTSLGALNQYLIALPTLDDDPKTYLRPVRNRIRRPPSALGSGSRLDDRKKVRKKKAVETQVFQSAAFIVDSDDDDEADAVFFAREKGLRAEMQALAEKHGSIMLGTGTRKRKPDRDAKGKEKARRETTEMAVTRMTGISAMEDEETLDGNGMSLSQPEEFGESDRASEEGEPDGMQKKRKVRRSSTGLDSGSEDGSLTQASVEPNAWSEMFDSDGDGAGSTSSSDGGML